MIYSVIMAGGVGSRFWPMSRRARPKHLLPLLNGKPLIEATIDRVAPISSHERVIIVTNEYQQRRITDVLYDLEPDNFLIEPFGRNTAPCIGLAAVKINSIDPKAVMMVLPADHIIEDVEEFQRCLRQAVDIASGGDSLLTIGIPPTRPETGYGYIQREEVQDEPGVYQVKTFAEKPNLETAKRFIKCGDFYWNSGIFIWRTDLILKQFEEYLPEHFHQLKKLEKHFGGDGERKNLRRIYKRLPGISIDYGIMEHARSVKVIEGRFGWGDIGSWEEAYRRSSKDKHQNAAVGDHMFLDSKRCYVNASRKFVAVVGMEDTIIVESGNALLVCKRDNAQDVKRVVEKLERKNLKRLL